ncbi:MAG: hypothetical protein Q4E68_02995 [Prevotellaceae bacterium]|nr:hypothetical protein [Prevotellaceae bacterium]
MSNRNNLSSNDVIKTDNIQRTSKECALLSLSLDTCACIYYIHAHKDIINNRDDIIQRMALSESYNLNSL